MTARNDLLDPGLAYLVGASSGVEKLSFADLDRAVELALGDVHAAKARAATVRESTT